MMENAFTFIKQSNQPTANWELVQIISHGTLNRIGTITNDQFQPLTIGGNKQAVWVSQGAITAISESCGSNTRPIYINSGNFTPSSANIGNTSVPLYMAAGVLEPCSDVISKSNFIYDNGILTIQL